jgi:GNAT superfamily N-acetyltransferase
MNAARLERLILDAWPARERAALNGWTLLSDAGVTGRVNAIAPLAYDGADLDAAIAAAVTWQAARGNRPCFKIADGVCAPSNLPDVLAQKGWRAHTPTRVMAATLEDTLARLPAPVSSISLTPDLLPAIDAIIAETATSEAEYAERRGIAARTPQPRRFAVLERDRAAAATGLTVLTGGWAAIFLMRTHPTHRRQGLARDILTALLRWARDAGASHAYLQVEASNAPAIALYEAAGFATAYAYAYWRPETTT